MKKRQKSCAFKRIAVLLALIMFAGMASADNYLYDDVGWGLESTGSEDVNYFYAGAANSGIYYMLKYPGTYNTSFHIDWFCNTFGGSVAFSCLNKSSTVWTWNVFWSDGGTTGTLSADVNVNASGNTGVCRIFESCGAHDNLKLLKTSFSSDQISANDYSFHSYIAGGKYTIPLVNRFYPQTTYVYGNGVDIGVPVTATNASAFYYTTFQSSCSSSSGIILADVDNWFEGVPGAIQQYSFHLNMTSIIPLNFTVYSPATTPNISLAAGESKTFSVAYSPLESLSAVAWYVNNGLVQYGANTTYVFNESIPGTYFLECQLEDNTCSQYPTIGWYISVGKTTSISGSTWGILGGLTSILPDTSISLFNTSLGISTTTVSDGFGDYVFSGLPPGGYNLTASKTGYYPVSAIVTTYYGYFTNTNFNKNFILTGGAPTTTTTTTTIATTTTLYTNCIGSLTENCGYYYNDSLSCSLRYACASGYCFQCAYTVPNYCSVDQLCYATTTTSTTSGTTSTTSGTTTTTSGTTTTIPTTTSSSAPDTTLNSTSNYNPYVPAFDCNNLTGMIRAGNITNVAFCAYVLPLGGVQWVAGLFFLFIVFFTYKMTKNVAGVLMAGLLTCAVFIALFPPIIYYIAPLVMAFIVAAVFKALYEKKEPGPVTEDLLSGRRYS